MSRPFITLAPMEGVVDWIVRDVITRIGGVDRAFTEFVRVTDQLIPAHVFYRYCPELRQGGRTAAGTPVFVQILGGQASAMAENAQAAVELGALGIDINFGCPAKTVNRHDGGAAILKNPERVFEITSAVRKSVPNGIPVTAKVRLGFDHKDFAVAIAQAVDSSGADAITIHARTKEEMYRPPAHWEFIAQMRESVRLPVISNGEIWSVEDFRRCQQVSGCNGFALGRGLVARPDLARQIRNATSPLLWPDLLPILERFYELSVTHASPQFALARLKQWTKQLSRNFPEAILFFEAIKTKTIGPAKFTSLLPYEHLPQEIHYA